MNWSSFQASNHICRNFVYVILLCLGVYFIYAGQIIQKFQQKRTNFAEYGEEITEFPTILTSLEYTTQVDKILEYGKDFNLTLQTTQSWEDGQKVTSLVLGQNVVGDGLKVDVSELIEHNEYHPIYTSYQYHKITPVNFAPGMSLQYVLTYKFGFKERLDEILHKTGISVTTENNTYCSTGVMYLDGEVNDHDAKLGEVNYLQITPEKYLYLENLENCRTRPFNYILAEMIEERVLSDCPSPCRPSHWFCKFGVSIDTLPVCQNISQEKCFDDIRVAAIEYISRNVASKPCTKVQYKVAGQVWYNKQTNHPAYKIEFNNPPKVMVKQEYLICDMLTMVGAIGGTLGLCIGFSFNEFFKWIWNYFFENTFLSRK